MLALGSLGGAFGPILLLRPRLGSRLAWIPFVFGRGPAADIDSLRLPCKEEEQVLMFESPVVHHQDTVFCLSMHAQNVIPSVRIDHASSSSSR